MKTQQFTIATPLSTHYVRVSCEEVECANHVRGWVTLLDPALHAHEGHIAAILTSGRHFTSCRSEEAAEQLGQSFPPGLRAFIFPPGQQCFERHQQPVGREANFLKDLARTCRRHGGRVVAEGLAGAPDASCSCYRHQNGSNWNEDFNEQTYALRRVIESG